MARGTIFANLLVGHLDFALVIIAPSFIKIVSDLRIEVKEEESTWRVPIRHTGHTAEE